MFVFMFKSIQNYVFIKHKVQFHSRNNLNILWEHVPGFHPESQSPCGHWPFTLSHLALFKQWQLLLHSAPKVPWLHSAIIKHSNNETERFVNDNNKCNWSIQNNTISVDSEDIENIRCQHKWPPLILSSTQKPYHW